MAIEIERKFLVDTDRWHPDPGGGVLYRQGYLSTDPTVRVRIAGDKAVITIKGRPEGISRLEFEYPIPSDDATILLDRLRRGQVVAKRRYRVPFEGDVWEVDVFEGDNAGLVIAEIELPSQDTKVVMPPWIGREVTGDRRYSNASLAHHPFGEWRTAAHG
ncbi:MAG: CYTH domain-containing protein [Gemmatimonadales bacterium]